MKSQYRLSSKRKTDRKPQRDRLEKYLTPHEKMVRTKMINKILQEPLLYL